MVCRVLGKPRSWLYYQRRSGRGRPLRRPELEESVRQLLGASPTSYGYRRIHALLKRRGVACNPKWDSMAMADGEWQRIATQLQETIPPRRGSAGGVMPEPTEGPTVLRILLGTQLRRLRESRRITAQEAARAIRPSLSPT